jgi:type VI secretion system protein VasG
MSLEVKALVAKLDKPTRRAMEEAAQLCVAQTHFNIEVEHLLLRLIDQADGEIRRILRYYEIDIPAVEAELVAASGKFARGNGRTPGLSPQILSLLEEAWLLSSVLLEGRSIRAGAVLLAVFDDDAIRAVLEESCPILMALPLDDLRRNLKELIGAPLATDEAKPLRKTAAAPAAEATGSALAQYTLDLTGAARDGKIDPIRGRDGEVRQLVDILMRRRQNNPILTGEAGVGKTAIVEGLALRIAAGDVPPPLAEVIIRVLDIGALQAGAGVRGEFENRLKSVIAEAAGSVKPVILFIDEAHMLIGAGGSAGQGDAANLLKPALARGELRTIAATTWAEYKKYFEKDPALARRFQVVHVGEPDEVGAALMLRGLVPTLEAHHKVRILDEAVLAAVRLSSRYIPGRQLPDKAISVLDTASARVAVGQSTTPGPIEALERRRRLIDEEILLLEREARFGNDHGKRIAALQAEAETVAAERQELDARWQEEKRCCREILEKLDGEGAGSAEIQRLRQTLADVQGEQPLVPLWVDGAAIAEIVAGWTGIPVGSMMQDEIRAMLDLESHMAARLVGQPQALAAIARRVKTYRANLGEPGKPVGVFLLVGPSGVGKTETAVTLAELLYGGERNMITINMSEYQEAHTVAGLKGSPPGYVGYGAGGVLTEAVRHNPYSIVLLDEVEKAHPDVLNLFYQVFDKGMLEDGEGIEVDFRNTIILLTSNAGAEIIQRLCPPDIERPEAEGVVEAIRPELLRHFKAAWLARTVVIPYYPLTDDIIRRIVGLKLGKLQKRLAENYQAELSFSEDVAELVARRCMEGQNGARNIDHLLTGTLMPALSSEVLERVARREDFNRIEVTLDADGQFAYRVFRV